MAAVCLPALVSCLEETPTDSGMSRVDTLYVVTKDTLVIYDSTASGNPIVGIWLGAFSQTGLNRQAACTLSVNRDNTWSLDETVSGLDSLLDTLGTAPDTLIVLTGEVDTLSNARRRYSGAVSLNPDFATFRWTEGRAEKSGVFGISVTVDTLTVQHVSGDNFMWCDRLADSRFVRR